MVLPPGHHQEIARRGPLSRLEKWTLGGVSAGLVVFVVILIIALTGAHQTTAKGCIDVSILGSTGGAAIHQCGADARALCRAAGRSGHYAGETRQEIQAACRKDGFAVG
jgi:hypothetical protein